MADRKILRPLFAAAIISLSFIGSAQAGKPLTPGHMSLYGGSLAGTNYACSVTNVSAQRIDPTITIYCMEGSSFCLAKPEAGTDLVVKTESFLVNPGHTYFIDFPDDTLIKKVYRCEVGYIGLPGELRGTFCVWDSVNRSCVPLSE